MLNFGEMRDIYQRTRIIRRPTYGIISGYHELPYVCLGAGLEAAAQTTCVRGKIMVSPRFLITPADYGPTYRDIFGDDEVDVELTGRMFGFLGFKGKPVECTSEYLHVTHENASIDRVLGDTLDHLERMEDITTGVVITPDSRYFPVSIERFIASILDDEFSS